DGEAPTPEQKEVLDVSITGDRRTLVADSAIPAAMAVIYLILLIYFKMIGGYKPLSITDTQKQDAEVAAGEFSEA
ncbi:MAG: hypothetical protein KDA89_23220, partial [Planctomycetaceae bacterium]|nr:hypothetical protein [Planctomycetaceae bacterium]